MKKIKLGNILIIMNWTILLTNTIFMFMLRFANNLTEYNILCVTNILILLIQYGLLKLKSESEE